MGMTAEEIKKAFIEKRTQKSQAIEPAEILGAKGFLFKSSSMDMEGWREIAGSKEETVRKLGPAKLVQISFRSEDGTRVFDDLDLALIGGTDEDQIRPVYDRCMAINGFGKEGTEGVLKNCVTILGGDGVYASLANMGYPCPSCTKGTAPTSSASIGSPSSTGPVELPPSPGGPS